MNLKTIPNENFDFGELYDRIVSKEGDLVDYNSKKFKRFRLEQLKNEQAFLAEEAEA